MYQLLHEILRKCDIDYISKSKVLIDTSENKK